MSILFIVLYLALPIGLGALALLGCRPADEQALGIRVSARKEWRR